MTNETVHKVPVPEHHFTLLQNNAGNYLGINHEGERFVSHEVDDQVIWDQKGNQFRHVSTGQLLSIENASADAGLLYADAPVAADGATTGDPARFLFTHGPEKLPSEYLTFFSENGWVCLTSILDPQTLEALERLCGTDRFAGGEVDRRTTPLAQTWAVARTAAEPVSLWLMRQYMGTDQVRLGHPPSLAILTKDDGKRDVQGWHYDFPYLWGFGGPHPFGRVPTASGNTVLGIQRNVCISPFTRKGGATAFKLGSHVHDQGPPAEWGLGGAYGRQGYRAEHGLPYNGPEADIVDAPGGSIILYDSRTWHRAGVNQTDHIRAAMLQAMVPGYVMPFYDNSAAYKAFLASDAFGAINDRERTEIERLMVHYMLGQMGVDAITVDPDLSAQVRANSAARGYFEA